MAKKSRSYVIDNRNSTDTNYTSAYIKGQKIKRFFGKMSEQGKGGEEIVVLGSKSVKLHLLEFQVDNLTREQTEKSYKLLMDGKIEDAFTSIFSRNNLNGR